MLATQIRAADEFRCTKPTIRLFTVEKMEDVESFVLRPDENGRIIKHNSQNMLSFCVVGE